MLSSSILESDVWVVEIGGVVMKATVDVERRLTPRKKRRRNADACQVEKLIAQTTETKPWLMCSTRTTSGRASLSCERLRSAMA